MSLHYLCQESKLLAFYSCVEISEVNATFERIIKGTKVKNPSTSPENIRSKGLMIIFICLSVGILLYCCLLFPYLNTTP